MMMVPSFGFLLSNMLLAQSCPTLSDPMDYTVHGILQARILEWVAVPFSYFTHLTFSVAALGCCPFVLFLSIIFIICAQLNFSRQHSFTIIGSEDEGEIASERGTQEKNLWISSIPMFGENAEVIRKVEIKM